MIYLCAWCGVTLPGYDSNGDERESHGICEPCALVHLPSHLHGEFLERVGKSPC